MTERMLYPTRKGSKPLNLGMNRAKRIVRAHDKRDQESVLTHLGPGHPRQHAHHQELIKQRHRYYEEVYERNKELRESQDPGAGDPEPGAVGGKVPEPAAGADSQ